MILQIHIHSCGSILHEELTGAGDIAYYGILESCGELFAGSVCEFFRGKGLEFSEALGRFCGLHEFECLENDFLVACCNNLYGRRASLEGDIGLYIENKELIVSGLGGDFICNPVGICRNCIVDV